MAYVSSPGAGGPLQHRSLRVEWMSAVTGGAVVMVMAYVGLVAPAWRQVSALEQQVAKLASSVAALNDSRDGVARATSLLERLEAQASRLAVAEATLERFEALGNRLAAQAGPVDAAAATLARIDELNGDLVARGGAIPAAEAALAAVESLSDRAAATREVARTTAATLTDVDALQDRLAIGLATLDEAVPAAERLTGLAATLADRADEADAAAARLDGLVALESGLVRMTDDLDAAESSLLRITDLATSLADASGTVGQLQRFVVDVMLLEPAIGRAVRALEPVVEFTRAGRRIDAKGLDPRPAAAPTAAATTPVTEVARGPADESR